ncbi:MAG: nucleotidyltransferase family protein [Thermoanaerobaculia bacterium]
MTIDSGALRAFCERHHITRLSLFGSALRGELSESSDIDVLVEFDPAHIPGFFGIIEMEEELTGMFHRKVDLRTARDLSRHFRAEVIREAKPLYEAI